ncbi:unnamed protein product, partial [Angiostrongylus costaricensis]|uniref:SET domain-containing protein n=1 Tax=Angiostrongylus costaricensis TaxID=334426 RepID=A0A158PME3_ANGCS
MNEATYGTDNAAGRNSVLWDEEDRVVEACAASKLYRKRRRAWLIAFPPALNDMIRENRSVRVEEMLKQLFPGLKSRSRYDHENIASDNSTFQEFIYNPFRNGPISRHRLSCDLSQGQETFPVEVYSDTENYDPPVEFTYISKNDYSNYRGRCSLQDTEGIAMGDGRVIINTDATFHNTLIVGCGERCACMAQCKNTLRSKCLPAPFKLNILQGRDMGLRGSRSLDYSFCLHQAEETQIYEKLAFARQMQHDAFDKWNEMVYIDQYRKGNIARFISHGCFPNLTVLRYAENDLRLHRSHAILFANQPIVGGSEIYEERPIRFPVVICLSHRVAKESLVVVKKHALSGAYPGLMQKYVDDCFVLCSTQEEMDKCFELLNAQSEYIKFTREEPKEKWLPFLNVQIHLSENGYITK